MVTIQLDVPRLVKHGACLARQSADAWFAVCPDNHAARQESGIGAITTAAELALRGASLARAGCIVGVEVRGRDPQSAFRAGIVFSRLARTTLFVEVLPDGLTSICRRAGMGVVLLARGQHELVVEARDPEVVEDLFTARFHEIAYREWLKLTASLPVQGRG